MEDSFSSYIRGEQILLKYAKGVGALRGKEFHEYHELILFIDGDVDFYSDEMHVKLVPDQLIIIPKESTNCQWLYWHFAHFLRVAQVCFIYFNTYERFFQGVY